MKEKIETNKKDTSVDFLALEQAKAQIQAFKQTKPVYSIYSKKQKMFVQTTNLDRYNELKIENVDNNKTVIFEKAD